MNMFSNFIRKISPNKKIIFIVEDNEVYATTLKSFIETRFSIIKEIKKFRIGETCLKEMHRSPHIVIMDYVLNSKYEKAHNGLEIIKRIKAVKPETNIIVVSAQENTDAIMEAMKEYNCRYVQKDQEAFTNVETVIKEIFNPTH